MSNGDVFAERLLQVIDEGRRTATYKLALLLALIDACAGEADEHGTAPKLLHTRSIAEHALRLYFPQVRLYLSGSGEELRLRQIANNRSAVLGAVLRLHLTAENHGLRTLSDAHVHLPAEYERCLDKVELAFARYPIRLLQVVGRENRPFLYDITWSESVSLRALAASGGGVVRFRDGAGDQLLRLAPLLRPLIELHWTREVARFNRVAVEEDRLRAHLFGTNRVSFPLALRRGLVELQDGGCFYCGDPLRAKTDVDHFLPWSRWPNDAVENLVLADGCNGRKSDYLPALEHVDRWATRLEAQSDDLEALASKTHWISERQRSLALARSCYAHVPAETPLWQLADQFNVDDPSLITARLARVNL